MAITDELREWVRARGMMAKKVFDQLTAIADRIDAEHKKVVMGAINDALYHANYDSMAELGWIRLPVDADDVPIRIGDKVRTREGAFGTIDELNFSARMGWTCGIYETDKGDVIVIPNTLVHAVAPTVEDVLREFADEVQRCCDTADTIAEYAAKLRLAEEVDE